MMTADEIDNILRLQQLQLHVQNPYTEDYYCQNFNQRQAHMQMRRTGGVPTHDTRLPLHQPIFEANPRPTRVYSSDPFAGALGRLPHHSVRAPRPLIDVGQSEKAASADDSQKEDSVNHRRRGIPAALLIAVEDAFNCLLDIEDADTVITPHQPQHVLMDLMVKRKGFMHELWHLLCLFFPHQLRMQGQMFFPAQADTKHAKAKSSSQADIFTSFCQIGKSRKLLARCLKLLPPPLSCAIVQLCVRHLSCILTDPNDHLAYNDEDPAIPFEDLSLADKGKGPDGIRLAATASKSDWASRPAPLVAAMCQFITYNMSLAEVTEAVSSMFAVEDDNGFRITILRVLSFDAGLLVLFSCLRRVLLLFSNPALSPGSIPDKLAWEGARSTVFQQLEGSFQALATEHILKQYGADTPMCFGLKQEPIITDPVERKRVFWNMLTCLAALSPPAQRATMHSELQKALLEEDAPLHADFVRVCSAPLPQPTPQNPPAAQSGQPTPAPPAASDA